MTLVCPGEDRQQCNMNKNEQKKVKGNRLTHIHLQSGCV